MPRLGYIALGSNLGDRQAFIEKALAQMELVPGLSVVRISSYFETAPQDFESEHLFLNSIAEVEWRGEPLALMQALLRIESDLGRLRRSAGPTSPQTRYTDRSIDLDIIWLEGVRLVSRELTIPHPQAYRREFVLAPLSELNPALAAELRGI